MKKIHKLSPHLIAQIAAGEVIERPSYAVKELVDNAIDAGATNISVSLENAGLKKIVINDNGEGMSKEDLFDAVKIHTTSKVINSDSLSAISSLGFRGEALASIASISQMNIKSKREDDLAGTEIEVSNGKIEKVQPVGMPTGTSIEVNNLFSSVPARKKFLKSLNTELRHIIEIFISFGLAFPSIKFTLFHNNKNIFELLKTEDHLSRFSQLLGSDLTNQLLPLVFEDSYIKINGYIARPQKSTTGQSKQYIFVNNRRISDKVISLAAKDGYINLLDHKNYPIVLLFLSIPFELVDVNVHPRKEQIGFANNQLIYDAVLKAIQETLLKHNLTFAKASFKKEFITESLAGKILRQQTRAFSPKPEKLKINYGTITQLHNLYLVIETKEGILFIDQHAAHERILFEQFREEYENLKTKSFELSKPIIVNLSVEEKLLVEDYQKILEEIGIFIDPLKSQITHIPDIFRDRDISILLNELLEDLSQKGNLNSIDQTTQRLLQFLACKQAIKAGDPLTNEESINLVKKLEDTENNYTCPHGRPTKYIFGIQEINRLFKRF